MSKMAGIISYGAYIPMLRLSLGLDEEAKAIENAVYSVIDRGVRTPDIAGGSISPVTTSEFGTAVAGAVRNG